MKKMIGVLMFAVFAFTSCTKSALSPNQSGPVSQTWIVQEGHDQAAKNSAYFCFASDWGKVDTLKITFNKEPNDSTEFSDGVGDIYVIPGKQTATDRYYAKLLEEIN